MPCCEKCGELAGPPSDMAGRVQRLAGPPSRMSSEISWPGAEPTLARSQRLAECKRPANECIEQDEQPAADPVEGGMKKKRDDRTAHKSSEREREFRGIHEYTVGSCRGQHSWTGAPPTGGGVVGAGKCRRHDDGRATVTFGPAFLSPPLNFSPDKSRVISQPVLQSVYDFFPTKLSQSHSVLDSQNCLQPMEHNKWIKYPFSSPFLAMQSFLPLQCDLLRTPRDGWVMSSGFCRRKTGPPNSR
ncbi:hypothetical protein THAOC_02787 [Thalassiosira oceanica]|uniref:Uncharacterized protein n=1 Tax=Thalassiosira oceanica TaxID=159749 RepID=K0T9R1_THAOC|nr:hypothetical protein THAOC_02787 [Thalassiosira oceanica]|eukprot:EJK75488.1 hypothetical protein THAOC_02787 [Thalassiosira oceanica]